MISKDNLVTLIKGKIVANEEKQTKMVPKVKIDSSIAYIEGKRYIYKDIINNVLDDALTWYFEQYTSGESVIKINVNVLMKHCIQKRYRYDSQVFYDNENFAPNLAKGIGSAIYGYFYEKNIFIPNADEIGMRILDNLSVWDDHYFEDENKVLFLGAINKILAKNGFKVQAENYSAKRIYDYKDHKWKTNIILLTSVN